MSARTPTTDATNASHRGSAPGAGEPSGSLVDSRTPTTPPVIESIPNADRIVSVAIDKGWSLGDNKVYMLVSVRYRVPGQKRLEKMSFRGETWEEAAQAFGLALDRGWPTKGIEELNS